MQQGLGRLFSFHFHFPACFIGCFSFKLGLKFRTTSETEPFLNEELSGLELSC